MSRRVTIDFEPLGRRIDIERDATLLEAARQAGVRLSAICGGAGRCKTCRVRIVSGEATAPTDSEREVLSQGFRLACQTRALSDLRVDVPPSSISAPQRTQIEGRERPAELSPAVRSFDLAVAPPGLTDLRADVQRVRDALRSQHEATASQWDSLALAELPGLLRANAWRIRVFVRDDETIAVAPAGVRPLGLAVDIGTTKLAGYLVDLEDGATLASAGMMNPQIVYGEDVMSRISYALQGGKEALALRQAVITGLNSLARTLSVQTERSPGSIVDAVLVGNTCMHHLALGLPVSQLGWAPYVPVLADPYDLKARDLGLECAPGAYVHFLPNIAGFVGADHVAMLLATGLHEARDITLGLDIGTNTEVSLRVRGRTFTCSCASGPAFEGAHIRDGMRAAPGAVERVQLTDGRVEYQTIDDMAAVGICGSGILDSVAGLRSIGALGSTGALRRDGHPRVRATAAGLEFLLVPAGEHGALRDLAITQKDVSEIQLAKAAIRAGIEILLGEAGVKAQEIQQVIVAGAFGTYLDIDSALSIGMFPPLNRDLFVQVGNASGIGAKLALLSRRHREVAAQIAAETAYVELTTHPRFSEVYPAALFLP